MAAAPAEAVLGRCRALGFALAGVAPAEPTRYEAEFREWLAAGRNGEMRYLSEHVPERLDPGRMLPGARSIICVADRYHDGSPDVAAAGGPPRGRVARYARGDDYHLVMKNRLHRLADELSSQHPHETFRTCVDTAPVLERELAQRAGLGSVGKHTLLIEPGVGSYLLLGEVITTLAMEPSNSCMDDPCGTCTRCIDACPTGAITPWSVDATRCISYLTIEHRTAVGEQYHEAIGDWIFGCDICQEVCPHNQPTRRSRTEPVHPAYAPRRDGFDLLEILGWDEQARRAAFLRSAMKRAKLSMMKRNAILAAGNVLSHGKAPHLRTRIEAIARDGAEDELVRSTASQVLHRLEGQGRSAGGWP